VRITDYVANLRWSSNELLLPQQLQHLQLLQQVQPHRQVLRGAGMTVLTIVCGKRDRR
jgi:hypothetical protein